ncbi:MAG: hypothetical protein ACRCTI_18230, partial [Beijerinckiaceae bacterium]
MPKPFALPCLAAALSGSPTFRTIATRCLTAAALLWTMPDIAVRPGWAGELREPPEAATVGAADEAVGRRGSDPYA